MTTNQHIHEPPTQPLRMNLRDQLKEILPDILPRNPNQAIKGTELIENVKNLLKQGYSDATLRYHFSIMSCDPSSPIAKVAQGQGYYLRTETIHSMNSAMNMISAGSEAFSAARFDASISRANKFRALVQRYHESLHQTPFSFEESFTVNALINRWRVPDMAIVDWLTGEATEDSLILKRDKQEVFRKLGTPPIQITSAKLRLDLSYRDAFEDLYQCLSTSEWSNGGELIVASKIEDPVILRRVREFSNRYGIGVLTFGLNVDVIEDLPEPAAIENLSATEFESILRSHLTIDRIATPKLAGHFNWKYVNDTATEIEDFRRFRDWISSCLMEERVIAPREFLHRERAGAMVAVVA